MNITRIKRGLLRRLGWLVSDSYYVQKLYEYTMGYKFDLQHPQTFNEKLQWLKVFDRKPEYTTMVDKVAVKDYVAGKIGREYIIPTIGVWDSPSDIPWDDLPDSFVLKATGGGGGSGVVIVKDKTKLDKLKAIEVLTRAQKGSIYKNLREWPYKNVPNRILAEELLSDEGKDLNDYKVHCFNGVPKVILCYRDRFTEKGLTDDFFSEKWEQLELKRLAYSMSESESSKPAELKEMLRLAEFLSRDIPIVCTDFYTASGKVYFGELTFCSTSGLKSFEHKSWYNTIGEWLTVPDEIGGGKLLIHDNIALHVHAGGRSDLCDYKFFCFNGHCEFFKVDFGRFVEHHANYYDRNARLLPFGEAKYPPVANYPVAIPHNLDRMISLAEELSVGIPFLRVDLYDCNGRIYFGETTFYPASGMGRFTNPSIDRELGKKLILPMSH